MPKLRKPVFPFGERLIAIRKGRGISQIELARRIGSSQRAISYYEVQADYPPGEAIVALAKGLGISTDELLGLKPLREKIERAPREQKFWRKFRRIMSLPDRDQRAVLRMINLVVRGGSSRER